MIETDETPILPRYRLPDGSGDEPPLPEELDTAERWRQRGRCVGRGVAPVGFVAIGQRWEPVYPRRETVPIESDADLDATSAAPANSRRAGVYEYVPMRDRSRT